MSTATATCCTPIPTQFLTASTPSTYTPNGTPTCRQAATICSIALLTLGWFTSPEMPSESDNSRAPRKTALSPGPFRNPQKSSAPSLLSIWTATRVSRSDSSTMAKPIAFGTRIAQPGDLQQPCGGGETGWGITGEVQQRATARLPGYLAPAEFATGHALETKASSASVGGPVTEAALLRAQHTPTYLCSRNSWYRDRGHVTHGYIPLLQHRSLIAP